MKAFLCFILNDLFYIKLTISAGDRVGRISDRFWM